MNLVSSVICALFFDGAVFNIIIVTSLHRAPLSPAGCNFFNVEKPRSPLSPAGCDFFNCGKAEMRLFNATFLKTRTIGGLLAPDKKKNLQYKASMNPL